MLKTIVKKLRKNCGYVLILVAVALPLFFAGITYLIKSGKVSHDEALKTAAAGAIGAAVLNAYNPGLTWDEQSDLVYSAGAQALNDKAYGIFHETLLEAKDNRVKGIGNYSNIDYSGTFNLPYMQFHYGHLSPTLPNWTLRDASNYFLLSLKHKDGRGGRIEYIIDPGGKIFRVNYKQENSKLLINFDKTNNYSTDGVIVCDCKCLNRKVAAYPEECDVDIILTIPTNYAASTTTNSDDGILIASDSTDATSTPVQIIATAYENFLKNHFAHTKGVAVGFIPYSGKLTLPSSAEKWSVLIPPYTYDDSGEPRLKQAQVYASSGKAGGKITQNSYKWNTRFSTKVDRNKDQWRSDNSPFGIMSRLGTDGMGWGVDLLSTEDPTTEVADFPNAYKFRRVNPNPCYLGYCNLLANACERTCPTYRLNQFFVQELTDDVQGIAYDMTLFRPMNDPYNKSNFLFLPVHWACNLLSSWTAHPGGTAKGKMAHPARNNKKKAVILVVNAPNNFEPNELTYLGFSNDGVPLPMSESDVIDFRNQIKSNGTIQGDKGIITYSDSGAGNYDSDSKQFICNGNGKLSFPRKGLIKVVVDTTHYGENSGKHVITKAETFTFSGPTLPTNSTFGYGTVYNSTQGKNFGGNLTGKKVRYKLENAEITSCKLYGQVLRDYVGQYCRQATQDIRELILNDGTPAKHSGSNPYTIYETFNITSSGNLDNNTELKKAALKFMDPCMTIVNSPYYDNTSERGEYHDDVKYVVHGITNASVFYCVINAFPGTSDLEVLTVIRNNRHQYTAGTDGGSRVNRHYWRVADKHTELSTTETSTDEVEFKTFKENFKLETYILNGKSLNTLSKTLGTDTDITKNACVFLQNNWICFNGDGKLEVTAKPIGKEGAITFYDDNRLDEIVKPSFLTFSNIKSSHYGAKPGERYTISEEQTFYIEPSQISDTTDENGNYYVQLNMENVSLISAEITNRRYTLYESEVTCGDNVVISTYHPEPFEVTFAPAAEASVTISNSVNTSYNQKYTIPQGTATKELDFDYYSQYWNDSGEYSGDMKRLNMVTAPKDKFKIAELSNATAKYRLTNRKIRWDRRDWKENKDAGIYISGDYKADDICATLRGSTYTTKIYWFSRVLDSYTIYPDYVLFTFDETFNGKLAFVWRSLGEKVHADSLGTYTFGAIKWCINNQATHLYNYQGSNTSTHLEYPPYFKNSGYVHNLSSNDPDSGKANQTPASVNISSLKIWKDLDAYTGEIYIYNIIAMPDDTPVNEAITISNGETCSFTGIGKVKLLLTPTVPKPTITVKKKDGTEQTFDIPDTKTITIDPETYEFTKNTDTTDGHPYYTVYFNLTNAKITNVKLVNKATTGIWYHKISDPGHCTYVDFSLEKPENSSSVNKNFVSCDNKGCEWDSDRGYWVAKPTAGKEPDSVNIFTNNSGCNVDAFACLDLDTIHSINTSFDSVEKSYVAGGLWRWFQQTSNPDTVNESFTLTVKAISSKPPAFIFGGYVLPVNNVLYGPVPNEGYQKNKNVNGALDAVAKDACTKLREMADKIYLIKYGTNTTALDSCVTSGNGKIYKGVNNARGLENALNEIAADIKTTAGYKDSRVVVETTETPEEEEIHLSDDS
ncbi:MAG: hypothetical protein K6C34_04960 [Alphaproteobacteria bacterium]|nr:hypothetical protein [Alphaproteobacteria bacterium]